MKADLIPTPLADPGVRPPVEMVAYRPPARFRRMRVLLEVFVLLARLLGLALRRRLTPAVRAVYIRQTIEKLGGLWIKFGQLVALRQDAFSVELCTELSKLQDQARAYPFSELRGEMEQRMGVPLEVAFSQFEETPVAAASIAQAHRARLRDGNQPVIVKIQKPYAAALFHKDLDLISSLVKLLQKAQPHLQWEGLLRELREIIREELDYRSEMSAIQRMRKTLREHRVIAPRVYPRYCNEMMLTMELLQGVFMTDFIQAVRTDPARVAAWCAANDVRPRKVARRLLTSQLRQIFEDNLFHGDVHPGNIVLFRRSRIGLIDFGSVGFLDADFKLRYKLYLSATAAGEYEKAVDYMLMFSGNLPRTDLPRLREEIVFALRSWSARTRIKTIPYHERSLAKATDEINQITLKYKVSANWTLLKVARAWATLDASLTYLDPQLDYLGVIRNYVRGSQRRQLRRLSGLPQAMLKLPRTISEWNLLLGSQMRLKALEFQASIRKPFRVMALLMNALILSLAGGVGLGIAVFLGSRFGGSWIGGMARGLLRTLFGGEAAASLLATAARSPHLVVWCVLGLLGVYLLVRKVKQIALEPDPHLA